MRVRGLFARIVHLWDGAGGDGSAANSEKPSAAMHRSGAFRLASDTAKPLLVAVCVHRPILAALRSIE